MFRLNGTFYTTDPRVADWDFEMITYQPGLSLLLRINRLRLKRLLL